MARNFLPLLKMRGEVNPKLLLLQEKGEFLDVLPGDIERVCLNEGTRTSLFGVIPKFVEALRKVKPDVVVACMWYPAIIAYMTKKLGLFDFKYIVHDTTTMSEYIKYEFGRERHKRLKIYLTRKAYMTAEKIIVVSKGEKDDLKANFGIPDNLVKVIYNPMNLGEIRRMAEDYVDLRFDRPAIVSVGRLIYSKGFDVLLRAFRKVLNHMDSDLLILGEGREKENLMSLSESLGLREKVAFLGFDHNPFKYMKRCQVFCTATRYEGLGNALIEAMTVGLPVIATDCRSGPAETLDGGKYGILVAPEDPDATGEALIRVLSDRKLQEYLSELSLRRAQDFDLETSMKHWEDAILAING